MTAASPSRPVRRGRRPSTPISDLEGAVLGLIGHQGPCTAYRIRRALEASPSTHWSASAGAIYPLLERLTAARYVAATRDPKDGRGRSVLSLTGAGRRVLRSWVLGASEVSVAASVFDAVRTRAFFLDSLSPQDRQRFAEGGLRALSAFLERAIAHERTLARDGTPFERLAASGAVRVARARVEWMREVRAVVGRG